MPTGLPPASCFALAEGHAKLGQATEANEAAAKATSCVPSDYLFMHTGLALATGWALAASGCLTHAVATARAAAAQARERSQPTHELVSIQAAAQWGDTRMRYARANWRGRYRCRSPMPLGDGGIAAGQRW
ncbi:hypothetical protein [Mycobacterium sp.]|uniref:hypothetical protein n=1 Tax=Mycobacterium sp. TaxID=1785 RepID=UPI0026088330|nr:hypothetical protein [Mycobacterium sp.]